MQPNKVPQIDWKKAPKRARWWAMDAGRKAYWYCAPDVVAFTDFWFSEPLEAPDFDYQGDWLKSLVERPSNDAKTQK